MGYEDERVIPDAYTPMLECSVCLSLMKDPVLFNKCRHMTCKECFGDLHRMAHIRGERPHCPECREVISAWSPPSFVLRRILGMQRLRCSHTDCVLELPERDIERHEEVCPHRLVRCPFGWCRKEVAAKDLSQHEWACGMWFKGYCAAKLDLQQEEEDSS